MLSSDDECLRDGNDNGSRDGNSDGSECSSDVGDLSDTGDSISEGLRSDDEIHEEPMSVEYTL